MKNSNKSSLITGIVLLALAALFSISLILQLLDFGMGGPGHNILFYLGNMLFTVYGFSSILIPVFLLCAGLSCFATTWTAKKTMNLLIALIPFFTAVVTEKICRFVLTSGDPNLAIFKILISAITGAMLIIIEFLAAGILADRINDALFGKKSAPKVTYSSKTDEVFDQTLENAPEYQTVPDNETVENADEYSVDEEEYQTEASSEDETENLEDLDYEESAEPYYEEPSEENTESESEEPEEMEAITQDAEQEETPAAPEPAVEEAPVSENPASIITQEEYAALTNLSEEVSELESADEPLEWPNLPPKAEELPPDYQEEEFDENDPALEFPPKDENDSLIQEINLDTIPQNDNITQEVNETDNTDEPEFIQDTEPETPAAEENVPEESPAPAEEQPEEENAFNAFNTDFASRTTEKASENEQEKETPFSAANYLDNIVSKNKYPHGIILHDDSEKPQPEQEEKKEAEPVKKSIYPSHINLAEDLADDLDKEIASFESELNENAEESAGEEDLTDTYVEDETLPFPDQIIDMEDPAEQADEVFDEPAEDLSFEEESLKPAQPVSPTEEADAQPFEDAEIIEDEESSDDQFLGSNKTTNIFSQAASDVFSSMEEDIRNNLPKAEDNIVSEVNFSGTDLEQKEDTSRPDLDSEEDSNLSKDELSDFFNAQTLENTPVTQEIPANPPKTNRATKKGPYRIPSDLLIAYKGDQYWIIDEQTKQASLSLKQTLAEFNIEAQIIGIKKGPVVTMFEILPAPGVKLSKIVALQDNIALSLAAKSVRIVAPIPGKQAVGIEVPNKNRSIVGFREIIEMPLNEWDSMAVPVILGKDILGKAQIIDLVKTPHMLIAGATGSGKSVCVNSLILSILYKRSYRDVKLILVDPKVVELKLYNDIPHLITPVITEPKKALQALQWCLCEMERRYSMLDSVGVRDISSYNQRIKERGIMQEKLPYIVVIIDEFADLMATSGRELESVIARLTAMSRAVGIHLVLATQRPSVNVITGLIKANIPSRIAFMVSSRTDSNIILDTIGAEKLLGKGDMLYASAVDPAPVRIQGTFVTDQEVENVVNAVKDYGEPDYIDDEIFVDDEEEENQNTDLFGNNMDEDPLYDQALEIVVQAGKASASYIQRRLKIGYNRAARLVEEMEERGIVGPANGSKPREIIHLP